MAGLGRRARNRGKTKSHRQGAVGAAERSHCAAVVPDEDKEQVQQASVEPAEAHVNGIVQHLHEQIAALCRKCHTYYMKEPRTKDLRKTVDDLKKEKQQLVGTASLRDCHHDQGVERRHFSERQDSVKSPDKI